MSALRSNNKVLQTQQQMSKICNSSTVPNKHRETGAAGTPYAQLTDKLISQFNMTCQPSGQVTSPSLKHKKLEWVANWVANSNPNRGRDQEQTRLHPFHPCFKSLMDQERHRFPSCTRPPQAVGSGECFNCRIKQVKGVSIKCPLTDAAPSTKKAPSNTSDNMQDRVVALISSKASHNVESKPSTASQYARVKGKHHGEKENTKDGQKMPSQEAQVGKMPQNEAAKLQSVQSQTNQHLRSKIPKKYNGEARIPYRNFSVPNMITGFPVKQTKNKVSAKGPKSCARSKNKTRLCKSVTSHVQIKATASNTEKKRHHKHGDFANFTLFNSRAKKVISGNEMRVRSHRFQLEKALREPSSFDHTSDKEVSLIEHEVGADKIHVTNVTASDSIVPLLNSLFSLSTDGSNFECRLHQQPRTTCDEQNEIRTSKADNKALDGGEKESWIQMTDYAHSTGNWESKKPEMNTTKDLGKTTVDMTGGSEMMQINRVGRNSCTSENNKLEDSHNTRTATTRSDCFVSTRSQVSVCPDLPPQEINSKTSSLPATDSDVSSKSFLKHWHYLGAGDDNNGFVNHDQDKHFQLPLNNTTSVGNHGNFTEEKCAQVKLIPSTHILPEDTKEKEVVSQFKPVSKSAKSYLSKLMEKRSRADLQTNRDKGDIPQNSANVQEHPKTGNEALKDSCEETKATPTPEETERNASARQQSNLSHENIGATNTESKIHSPTKSIQQTCSVNDERSESVYKKDEASVTEEKKNPIWTLSQLEFFSKNNRASVEVRTRLSWSGRACARRDETTKVNHGLQSITNTSIYRNNRDERYSTKALTEYRNSLKSTLNGASEEESSQSVEINLSRRQMPEFLRKSDDEPDIKSHRKNGKYTKHAHPIIFSQSELILKKNRRRIKGLKSKLRRRDLQLILLQTSSRGIPESVVLFVPRSGRYTTEALHDILYRNEDNTNAFLYSNFPKFSRKKLFDRTESSSSHFACSSQSEAVSNYESVDDFQNGKRQVDSLASLRNFYGKFLNKPRKSHSKKKHQRKNDDSISDLRKSPVFPKPIPNGLSATSESQVPSPIVMFPFPTLPHISLVNSSENFQTLISSMNNSCGVKGTPTEDIMESQSPMQRLGKAAAISLDKLLKRNTKRQISSGNTPLLKQQSQKRKPERSRAASAIVRLTNGTSKPQVKGGDTAVRMAYAPVIPQPTKFRGTDSSITTVADFRKLQAQCKRGLRQSLPSNMFITSTFSNEFSVALKRASDKLTGTGKKKPTLECIRRLVPVNAAKGRNHHLQSVDYEYKHQSQMKKMFIGGRQALSSAPVTRVPLPPKSETGMPLEGIVTRRLESDHIRQPKQTGPSENQFTVSGPFSSFAHQLQFPQPSPTPFTMHYSDHHIPLLDDSDYYSKICGRGSPSQNFNKHIVSGQVKGRIPKEPCLKKNRSAPCVRYVDEPNNVNRTVLLWKSYSSTPGLQFISRAEFNYHYGKMLAFAAKDFHTIRSANAHLSSTLPQKLLNADGASNKESGSTIAGMDETESHSIPKNNPNLKKVDNVTYKTKQDAGTYRHRESTKPPLPKTGGLQYHHQRERKPQSCESGFLSLLLQ